ncbi:MAG: DUF899 domain-containing protein [Xanthobacteraceae bacterium]
MQMHKVVSGEQWLTARKELLAKEKEFTWLRDELSRQRRELPWVKVEKNYAFQGPNGKESLSDLFAGRSQLVVYHFMFDPSWTAGCKSCSFWADNFNSIIVHLNQRDVSMVAISTAPCAQLDAFQKRMGWNFKWLSAGDNGFNRDLGVTFTQEELKTGKPLYNFGTSKFGGPEAPGISVFCKNDAGEIFRTYSTYSRGLDMLNGAYHYLDLVPKGRDEDKLSYGMEWVRLRDEYGKK